MIDSNLLMRRALRQACDDNNLVPDTINMMDTKTRNKFQSLVIATADDMKYDQLKYFRPFDHQKKFFLTGKSDRRGILAANRIGKTVSTCYEVAMHLTGRYPTWWKGKVFTGPITVMVAGEGWQQVAMVLQNELLGTQDIKITEAVGTGAIPRDSIVFETMRKIGRAHV